MYIQDSTLASIFHEKEAEFIENTESEILAKFKTILESDNFKADRAVIRAGAVENYKKFLNDFCTEYKEEYERKNGRAYVDDHPGRKNIFNSCDKIALIDEYRVYLKKLLVK